MSSQNLHVTVSQDRTIYYCQGAYPLAHVPRIRSEVKLTSKNSSVIFDLQGINDFDTHGILMVLDFVHKLEDQNCTVSFQGASETWERLYGVCAKKYPRDMPARSKSPRFVTFFYTLGKNIFDAKTTLINFFSFTGGVTRATLKSFINPSNFRYKALFYHIEQSGFNSIPIIFLISFLIGIIIAFQGAVQLEKFGANIFIVETVVISATRELAPLLCAIVIAGRSASAFAAQIGVMKITDEIDAMRTMGFSIWDFLIVPRVLALTISLPLLVFFSDLVSIFGGMVVASMQLGISFEEFALRMQESVPLRHVYIGLLKAPIFGGIIAMIGCFRGFQISSSTQSVGKYTTISVVNAIFWVIAMDALISVFLTEMDL